MAKFVSVETPQLVAVESKVPAVVVPVETIVEAQLPGYEGVVILPERVQAVVSPGPGEGTEFTQVFGYEFAHWHQLSEQIEDKLPMTQAVLLGPATSGGEEWQTTMLITGPNQIVAYVAVKWEVALTKAPTTFLTATFERSERNIELRDFGIRPLGDSLLFARGSGLVA